MMALQLKRPGCLKIESNNKAHPSCPNLIRTSINLRKTVLPENVGKKEKPRPAGEPGGAFMPGRTHAQ
jgi:hypothetical protein